MPEEASQHFNCGNIAVLPQDSTKNRSVLLPSVDDVRDAMCVVFSGRVAKPTKETIKKFKPVLVLKSRVELLITFLMANTKWYQDHDVHFSRPNLGALFDDEVSSEDEGILNSLQIMHLPCDTQVDEAQSEVRWSEIAKDLVTENGIYESRALAFALDSRVFLASCMGLTFLNEGHPGLMSFVFPHLDPSGIGGFNHPARLPSMRISMEMQDISWNVEMKYVL
ncbi:hypothetical protein PAXRUDRAFT_35378 [Paxillus rubicundulus Ve08.2h10]|uniref:DUF6570 domain-containing protein n=1 Tax=Paxillus rubicundulus Ve08.2h10 TaxID=930991 RepID=A0A0D0DCI8_9AGAM|nr:hypothetical protein PAXRUDRAFT_35378 [Paxillus rubicundulus Ve08.2h10]